VIADGSDIRTMVLMTLKVARRSIFPSKVEAGAIGGASRFVSAESSMRITPAEKRVSSNAREKKVE
jgi:hypothetical protein